MPLLYLLLRHFRIEAVSETANAADERSLFHSFDLLPQTENIDVHCAIRDCAVMAPHGVEQLLPAEHDSRTAHQEFQQTKFSRGERYLDACDMHAASRTVEFEIAALEHLAHRRRTAEMDFYACDQLAHEKRFDDVVVGAELEPDD